MTFRSVGWGAKQRWYIDGLQVTKEEFDAALPNVEDPGGDGSGLIVFKEIKSLALSVHPGQVEAANARNKRHGVGVSYDPTGLAHVTSRANRKKLLRLEAFSDNSGGYGD